MIYNVDAWNNFCRVFELPETYPEGYLFGGGKPVEFLMIDWFQPIEGVGRAAVTKEVWKEKVGEIKVKKVSQEELIEILVPFLSKKRYIKKERKYLILCDFGAALTFNT